MKTLTIFILTLLFFACEKTNNEGTVSIVDYRNSQAPSINTEIHKDKDAEIFRTVYLNDTYSAIMYRLDNGELKGYQAYFASENDFDKASYTWTTDSTLSVKLIDSSGNSENFAVTGYGTTTELTFN